MATHPIIEKFIVQNILKDKKRILDIGGGRNPFPNSTHVIDRRAKDEFIGGKKSHINKLELINRDFYDLPWPFKDNYFDFSICIGTLEDLKDPIPIIKEINRVSKAGYICTPTRAKESFLYIRNRSPKENGINGYLHHNWFVEIINDTLTFKKKNWLLSSNKKLCVNEVRKDNLDYFWSDKINYQEVYFENTHQIVRIA